jgi:O-methyltransferase involved in polyketide biosynthesis
MTDRTQSPPDHHSRAGADSGNASSLPSPAGRAARYHPRAPSIARVYDFLLGGKDNFAADRELGQRLLALNPLVANLVRENRQFLTRAVAWVASQGISQFIDLGAGMPTSPSTHEVARQARPGARTAYVDSDPVVVSHLRALLASGDSGVQAVDADVRDVDAILAAVSGSASRGVIDLTAPACLIMGSLLHFFEPDAARDLVARYVAALAPGSHLVLSVGHGQGQQSDRFFAAYNDGAARAYNHPVTEIATFFGSLEMVPPGVTDARRWRTDWADLPALPPLEGQVIAGVARVSIREPE